MSAKLIPLRYAGRCKVCNISIAAQAYAWYDRDAPARQRIMCGDCMAKDTPSTPSTHDAGTLETIEGKPCYVRHWGSLSEHATCKPSATNAAKLSECFSGDRQTTRSVAWYGIAGGGNAVRDTIANGWPDGAQRMESALTAHVPVVVTGIKRRRVRADFGDSIDMQRVYRGELGTAWERTTRQRGHGGKNTVTMYVDVAANCSTEAETLFWRGAAALAVADALTQGGYSVQITAGAYGRNVEEASKRWLWHTVLVKPANAPLDKSALASVLCLAGYFRTLFFTGFCSVPGRVHCALGVSTPRKVSELDADITGVESCVDQVTAQAWIDATLAPYIAGGEQS